MKRHASVHASRLGWALGLLLVGPTYGQVVYEANGHTYQLTSTPMSYLQAEAEAVSLGGHLVSINDPMEQTWLLATFQPPGVEVLWIGFSDRGNEGVWRWEGGDVSTYSNWGGIEPNNNGDEDFAVMQTTSTSSSCCSGPGKWADIWENGHGSSGNWPHGLLSGDVAQYGIIEISTTGPGFCFGDSDSSAACPCGNNGSLGHGCANSIYSDGGLLIGAGLAVVSSDTVLLHASSLSGNAALFFQGTSQIDLPFDDGKICVSGTVLRIGVKPVVANGIAVNPTANDLSISVKGAVPAFGGTRYYQAVYRNLQAFCTTATTNRTNGLKIVWTP